MKAYGMAINGKKHGEIHILQKSAEFTAIHGRRTSGYAPVSSMTLFIATSKPSTLSNALHSSSSIDGGHEPLFRARWYNKLIEESMYICCRSFVIDVVGCGGVPTFCCSQKTQHIEVYYLHT
jgi:hypothetical protein